MSEENNNPNADTAANQPVDTNGAAPSGKVYTEAEINAMMADRLAKHERSLKKTWETEKAEIERRAKLDEAERLKAEKEELENLLKSERAERVKTQQLASLTGKVTDPEYALYKANQNPDKYLKDDSINADALLKDYPNLSIQPEPKPGPAPTTAGGSTTFKNVDMNTLIRAKAGRR